MPQQIVIDQSYLDEWGAQVTVEKVILPELRARSDVTICALDYGKSPWKILRPSVKQWEGF